MKYIVVRFVDPQFALCPPFAIIWTIKATVCYRDLNNSGGCNEMQTHDLCDTCAMIYQQSSEVT